jgi:hypothetical protein
VREYDVSNLAPEGAGTPPRRPRLWPWVTLLVVGAVVGIASLGTYVGTAIDSVLSSPTYVTPYAVNLQLSDGTYYVFQEETTTSNGQGEVQVSLTASDVTVTSNDGGVVPVINYSGSEFRISDAAVYQAVVSFSVSASGTYHVTVASPGVSVRTIVAPGIATAFSKSSGWLVTGALGALMFLLGMVLVIVTAVRRGNLRRASVARTCANGHDVDPTASFCPSCGVEVGTATAAVARR